MPTYHDFTITIYASSQGYELTAHGPGEISVPPQRLAADVAQGLRENGPIHTSASLSGEEMKSLGTRFYRALFPPAVAGAFAAAQQVVLPEGCLRLRLAIYPPELNALPWELLYHPEQGRFLAALLTQPVVRYIESATPVAPLPAEKPLRLLYVQSMPADLPSLDLQASERTLRQALGATAEISVLRQPTRQGLQDALRQPYHVLHYDGHAYFDETAGGLLLADENGNAQALGSADLAYALNGTSIRLVVLAACQSGMDASRARFSGLAHELMKTSNLPAVVAMQDAISDEAAIAFNRGFYHALADEYPLDAAVTEGRKAILAGAGGEFTTAEWATPVIFLRGAGELFALPADAPAPGVSPYKGLQYFDENDADLFFGREQLSLALAERLRAGRFLVVVGASGSGKSSLVRAGLLPRLRQAGGWAILPPFTPGMGSEPLLALATALIPCLEPGLNELDRLAEAKKLAAQLRSGELSLREVGGRIAQKMGAARLALVVDQFEELFTTFRDKTPLQAGFVDALLLAAEGDSPLTVILTLRADFYAACAQFASLRTALENHQAFIGPMSSQELRQAIEEPARRGGWQLEEGLVDTLLHDVGDEPGNLPLLSHALLETWQRRKGRLLTLKGYQQSGGVSGAIARTADNVLHGLSADQQAIARRIFLGLTELGEGTQDTRRRAPLEEIAPQVESRPAAQAVLKLLADARLVTTSAQAAEVAHEALIREWPALRRWLDEDRASLRLHRELNEDTREWGELQRDAGALYRGARLAAAAEWAGNHTAEMTPLEAEFLHASRQAVEQEQREREAQRQRELHQAQQLVSMQRQRATVLAVGLVVALALAVLAIGFMFNARENLGKANVAGTQAAENLQSAQQNAATATHALGLSEQRGTQAAEQAAAAQAASTQAVAEQVRAGEQSRLALSRQLAAQAANSLAEKPDLAALLSVEAYRAADTFEARNLLLNSIQVSPRLAALLQGDHLFSSVAFSPDGARLAANGPGGEIIFWNTATWQAAAETLPLPIQDRKLGQMFFTPDSESLIVSYCAEGDWYEPTCSPGVWDLSSERATYQALPVTSTLLALSPNGWLLAAAYHQSIQLWDVENGLPLGEAITIGYEHNVTSLAFSPDEKWLLVGEEGPRGYENGPGQYSSIAAWNVAAARQGRIVAVTSPLGSHENGLKSLAFSADGTLLASGGCAPVAMYMVSCPQGELQLWQVSSSPESGQIQIRALASPLTTQHGPVGLLAFSQAGTGNLVINGADNQVSLYDLTTLADAVVGGYPLGLALDASQVKTFTAANGTLQAWALNPSGNLLAAAALGQITIWDVAPRQEFARQIETPQGHSYLGEGSLRFTPEGQGLLFLSGYGELFSFDLQTPGQSPPLQMDGFSGGLVYIDGNGQPLGLLEEGEQAARLWNLATKKPLSPELPNLPYPGYNGMFASSGMSLSQDGETLGVVNEGYITLWDISMGPDGEALSPQAFDNAYYDHAISVALNPPGTILAIGKEEGGITLVDTLKRAPIAQLMPGSIEPVTQLAFDAGGKMLAAGICVDYRRAEEGAFCAEYAIQLWDVGTWQPLGQPLRGLPFAGANNYVAALAFRADGKALASVSMGNELVLWDLSPESWSQMACGSAQRNLTQAEWALYFPGEAYRLTCPQWPGGE